MVWAKLQDALTEMEISRSTAFFTEMTQGNVEGDIRDIEKILE